MRGVVNLMYINLWLTYISVIFSIVPTMADVNANEGIKPMVTSGYRMFSSIYTQHVVSIRILEVIKYRGDNHVCGGTIIAPNRILTAAHCIEQPMIGLVPAKAITVCAGSPMRITPTGEERFFNVSEAVVHPDYSIDPVYADIAYLILSETIPEVEDVIKIALLAEETPKSGTLCTAVGWGRVFEYGPMPDEILHVDLYILNKIQCLNIQPNMRDGIFCAGDLEDRGKGTCHGDSGGPLFCDGKLTGVVSYGIGCGWSEVTADFYMEVPSYVSWLNVAAKQCRFPTVFTIINQAYFFKNKFFF